MPRIPKPEHNCAPISTNTDVNLKLKVLEDRLKKEFAPRDFSLLKDARIIEDGSFIYIYNDNEPDPEKKLKKILIADVTSIITDDVEGELDKFALKYKIVRNLPVKGARNTIYLVPAASVDAEVAGLNEYDEYLWIEQLQKYEKLGYTKIDLSAYRKAAEQDVIDTRLYNDLQNKIVNEATKRQNDDRALQTNINTVSGNLATHAAKTDNPHGVTKAQVGLSKVQNLSPLEMPISTATQNALDGKQNTIDDLEAIREGATAGASAIQADDSMTDAEIAAI